MDSLKSSSSIDKTSRYGINNYVQYIPGGLNSNIIISATHGGSMRPRCIPNRQENLETGSFDGINEVLTKSDVYTKQLALLLREEIQKLLGDDKVPHLVICNLHRSKVDMNREVVEACLNVPEAITAYNEFHEFLTEARTSVCKGLLLDLHGHTHSEEWVELGYLISKKDLLTENLLPDFSSIRSLGLNSTCSFKDLISGSLSLGKFLQDEGIDTVPSPKYQNTEGNCFTGGYTIFHHGSLSEGYVDAIQIEIHKKYRNKEMCTTFVPLLGRAIKQYMDLHYGCC